MATEKTTKPKAIYEPGELDRTRKNIGEIDPEEAQKLTKILGGEIGVEKTPLYDEPNIKKVRTYAHRSDAKKTEKTADEVVDSKVSKKNDTKYNNSKSIDSFDTINEKSRDSLKLPIISSKEKNLMDKLMSSYEYRIKNQYGFFTYLIMRAFGNTELVSSDFVITIMHNHICNLQKFITALKQLVKIGNDGFKKTLAESDLIQYRILRYLVNMDITQIRTLYAQIERYPHEVNVMALIPLTKNIYRLLLPVYFYGDKNITEIIKNTYTEIAKKTSVPSEKILPYAKEAASQWLYISGQIVKGMYPLLMRMCSTEYYEYPAFFTKKISSILRFLDLTKYDLFLQTKATQPIKKVTPIIDPATAEKIEQEEQAKLMEKQATIDAQNSIIRRGLELLDKMFPKAGWMKLEEHPDMYPYFQGIYNFKDGFNLINPENPMQITIILVRIIEDFFQGCRNIRFSIDKEPEFSNSDDTLHDIFSEWSLYRESLFDKNYSSEIKDYVNHLDTQSDFARSPYAKKKLCNLQWQAKYTFLPHLTFELVFMEKPLRDTSFKPLYSRTKYLLTVLNTLVSRIEDYLIAEPDNMNAMPDYGASNILEHYRFDVPNSVSKRLNYFLGGKKSRHTTNLNLLKYALCVISVLDWWINDEDSPAYDDSNVLPYRALDDGKPIFSVPLIENANDLFIKTPKM